jgi:hypothetical protein
VQTEKLDFSIIPSDSNASDEIITDSTLNVSYILRIRQNLCTEGSMNKINNKE